MHVEAPRDLDDEDGPGISRRPRELDLPGRDGERRIEERLGRVDDVLLEAVELRKLDPHDLPRPIVDSEDERPAAGVREGRELVGESIRVRLDPSPAERNSLQFERRVLTEAEAGQEGGRGVGHGNSVALRIGGAHDAG